MTSPPLIFNHNDYPTLGVELEVQLVDHHTMGLVSAIEPILKNLPPGLENRIKPELMQCYLEVNTDVCRTVDEVGIDLADKVAAVERAANPLGVKVHWSGTHPFSNWRHQEVTNNARYHQLIEQMEDTARRLVTFGLHVHVGVDTGDKAIMICDRIVRHLPTLLALSSNSPFWNGRDTGLCSQRIKVLENLPTAGPPPLMRNWSEFVWLVRTLIKTGFIQTIREIWWDVRPHHGFGTVEVRVCDTPADLKTVLALTALVQCLVHALSKEIDNGVYFVDSHPMMARQNRWRACRYGLDAELVDPFNQEPRPARKLVEQLVALLRPVADELGCTKHLETALELAAQPSGASRQRIDYAETHDLAEVVRRGLARSRLTPSSIPTPVTATV
ncbi:glutamate--cysteine ligase GCS2 [Isosphaera pallida ATCC 43644]|uniref:Putative glutamate--cysteine ligase 2 n=1 Tax=Isosphaera pallida (strain ATCC 43644 / DSM 9630 / IS1B) TaxID=575540 RepID=E8R5H7_ISOPI|nr:YbdK family carboxylate-amine ligase [Isosphaera pallida]ADV60718.1 glutamate--cysteine ligase GCS2 [Isosphaera pallida ATCC 43644]